VIKFSIVITTYNRLSLLKRAIASALAQTLPCEVLVVDDNSTDGTQEYVAALQQDLAARGHDRLQYYRNPVNRGHSHSVNTGVERACGDWIKLLDDDDYLAPNCLEEMSQAIALRSQAVICSCQAVQVDESELELRRTKRVGPGKAFYIPQEDIHHGMLLEQVPFGTPVQVAFERATFLKTGGWDSGFDANFDDIDSWIKIACFGDAIFINQCLAYRTVWPGALNYRFSWQHRLETNILIKQKIHRCIHAKYRQTSPSMTTIENYLKLHWGLAALKKRQVVSGIKIMFPALFAFGAWQLLLSRRQRSERFRHLNPAEMPESTNTEAMRSIRKLVLIESR
jgi:glycosyltransferase involved in cell wall biosynthesis